MATVENLHIPTWPKDERSDRAAAAGLYLLHLMACSFSGDMPASPPPGVRWKDVFEFARVGTVEGLSWGAVARLGDVVPEDIANPWRVEANMTLYRRARFDVERAAILDRMKDAGMAFMPLKGAVLAPLYPQGYMRSMADNDILYGYVEFDDDGVAHIMGDTPIERKAATICAMEDIEKIFKARGYQVKSISTCHHDSFYRKPIFNFEMHRSIANKGTAPDVLFENPWICAVPDGDAPQPHRLVSGGFHMSPTDLYVYTLAHASKHYYSTGCGIRYIADEYVLRKSYGEMIDFEAAERDFDKVGISRFADMSRKLSEVVFGTVSQPKSDFSSADYAKREKALLEGEMRDFALYLLTSGIYGSAKDGQRIMLENAADRASAQSKEGEASRLAVFFEYTKKRFILNEDEAKNQFPWIGDSRILLACLPVYRTVCGLARNPSKLARELRYVVDYLLGPVDSR